MNIFGFEINFSRKKNKPVLATASTTDKKTTPFPKQGGRSSSPPSGVNVFTNLASSLSFVNPEFNAEAIKTIRKLRIVNADVGLALNDMRELTNTGHVIRFGESVNPDRVDAMRKHIKEVSKKWGDGVHGIDGLVNKMITQIWIGGALSVEWVPDLNLTGISNIVLVNPEDIRFTYNTLTGRYEPYQNASEGGMAFLKSGALKKLNTNQYIYCGMGGDGEVPYGIPPFIAALNAIERQKDMDDNIAFIIKQIGVMGFLEFLMEKPQQNQGENDAQYLARLETTLERLKTNIQTGFKDGIVVGYNEDHKANFHSTTTNINGLDSIYNLNEVQVANGLKTSPSFIGADSGNSQSSISIVFTKMLSQLANAQKMLSYVWEIIYKAELRMAGFKPKDINSLYVEFKPSTITDDLKLQQSGEIKRRNLDSDYNNGIISQETRAEMLGYEKPDQKEPRFISSSVVDPEVARQEREAQKNESDRRVRDKNNPQPKRGDRDTKTR